MDYKDDLSVAFEAAKKAGKIIDEASGEDLRRNTETEAKENINDLVTSVDKRSQTKIVDIISEEFPDDKIGGEEEYEKDSDSNREWIIDPVDGTANFSTSLPYYCVSIALHESGTTQLAVIHSPESSLGQTWYAVKDKGAYVNERPDFEGNRIEVSDYGKLEGATIFSRLSERSKERREVEKEIVLELLDNDIRYRRTASAAINLAMVAEGKVDGLGYTALGDYDIDAGILLVEEAGGETRKQPSNYENKFEIVASNGRIQDQLENVFDEYVPSL